MKPILALALAYVVALGSPAYAYLDPITGSFLLQALIGAVASAMIAIRKVREKILSLVGIRKIDNEVAKVSEDSPKI